MIYKEFACNVKTTQYDWYIKRSTLIAQQMEFGSVSIKNFFMYQYLCIPFYEAEVIIW